MMPKNREHITNPFRFGTIVEGDYFTDREKDLRMVMDILSGQNHLVMISPRRFGKTSLIHKAVKEVGRPCISIDLQSVTSVLDLSTILLKKTLKKYPYERVKHFIKHFKVVPLVSLNPQSNSIDISFQPGADSLNSLNDALQLIERIGKKGPKPIVFFDEFQEILSLDKNLDKQLRSIIQYHQFVNYIFIGSYEGMMRDIFEKKKSPFYHFGHLLTLGKIPYDAFFQFLHERFSSIADDPKTTSKKILDFTKCHPYYTQQLAWQVWNNSMHHKKVQNKIHQAIQDLIRVHDNDYDRIWNTMGKTDRKILIALTHDNSILEKKTLQKLDMPATSTVFSSLKRLMQKGYLYKADVYEFDDPFFREWIIFKREI